MASRNFTQNLRRGIAARASDDFGPPPLPRSPIAEQRQRANKQQTNIDALLDCVRSVDDYLINVKRAAHDWHIMRSSNHNERPWSSIVMANSSLPQSTLDTFQPISASAVHVLARLAAKKAVQEELRAQGVRPTQVKPAEISALAHTYLANHPELWRAALERAQHMAQKDELRRRKPHRSVA